MTMTPHARRMLALTAAALFFAVRPPNLGAQSETAAPGREPVRVCLVVDGQLAEVPAEVDPRNGDTLVYGRPLDEALLARAAPYLAAADWIAAE